MNLAAVDPNILAAVVGAAIGAVGGITSAWTILRGKQRDDRQMLIDQLQEERNAEREERRREREEFATQLAKEREEIAAERVEHSERLDKMWADKSASRAYIGSLERHIWDKREPPPPTPPVGYIP